MAKRTTHLRTRNRLLVTAVSTCFAVSAHALPTAPTVVNGSASFAQAGNVLNVTNSNGAIINWNTFSIGANETTRFIQPSVSSSVLNRVLASDPSVILGTLTSNGRVFLINPNGILVGQGARVDVAGFVASTLDISDANFLANKLQFDATPHAGGVVNQGSITTPSGGSVYLVAPNISNEGIITTPQGETVLAAGQTITLLDTATPGVSVEITGAAGNATNLGQIVADAGRIGIAGVLVKNSGTLNASSVVNEGGRIFLKASGNIDTTATSSIAADGTNGGNVVLVADDTGSFAGTISARGDVHGGLVETSGHRTLSVSGLKVDTRAADGSAGTWLLDPADVVIAYGAATGNSNFSPTGSTSTIYDGDINAALVNNNVIVATSGGSGGSGNITVNGYSDPGGAANFITSSSVSGQRMLTLNADGNIDIHSGASFSGRSTAPLALTLTAGGSITHAGSIYSYGAPVTLVANWDGSTLTPGVAATPNCAGSYCGISGSGSINTDGSSAGQAGGNISIRAAGDIDLSNVSVSAIGSSVYYSPIAGGAGGNVSIASTQGNLTTGSINVSGGRGGDGASGASSSSPNGGTGGVGGAGGSISLSASGTLTLQGNSLNASGGSGGTGGTSYWNGSYSGTGGTGGAGGNVGTLSLSGTSLTLAGITLNFQGGQGGSGGYDGTGYGATGAVGASSPIVLNMAGDIVLTGYNYAYGPQLELLAGKSIAFGNATTSYGYLYTYYGTPATLVANWDGNTTTPGVAATGNCAGGALCGIFGSGSLNTAGYYSGQSGGDVTLKAAGDINLTQISIYANGSSGSYATSLAGGAGGNVSIASTQGNLAAGYVNLYGGSGGSGAYGTAASPNGGTGGVGGAGGSISLSTPGTLTLTNSIYVNGGSGGAGSSGYDYWDSATSSYIYTGTGGNGGAGGNAGSFSYSGETSLALAGATLDFRGGAGGSGSTYGTASGTTGVDGSGSPVILATTGDVVITNSNTVYGSQIELLAGKGMTFGNATTSYGYLYSYGAPLTLMANWDGVSTAAPAVAATGNCTGSSLCGISGSGNIYTNDYYYYGYGQPGGDISIKAAGDIDLSQVSIYAYGNSGYYATSLTGGAGGNVSIASTQGDLTLGYIDAEGGYGGSGASGTSVSPNGGTGGVGGVGGNVNFSTPGTLTLTSSIYANGGSGGSGGGGYYYWDSATSSYIYTGTGGNGGAGGVGGSVNVTAPSIAGSYGIDVSGGSGSYASSGTGSATGGDGGNAGSINLAVTGTLVTGNLTASGGYGGSGASGTATSLNGGMGGTGGASGSISLTTPGTLTLTGSIYATGGSGGSGGSGYYYWDSTTSSYIYTGAGGNGGAGGNAGTFAYSGESSLALAGTDLNFQGGQGGSGGYGVSAYAADGALGSSSPIVLATSGDIILTNSNSAYGSQLSLLAGRSISFGDATTGYGYLYTNDAPATLIANWDGNKATPGVAATGNCVGGALCGISGSGDIYTNDYYYSESYSGYGQAGGNLSIQAAGDIDLSNIWIETYGNSGYYTPSLTGGAGGNVSIVSTQGNLTVGYIDASGGWGGSGVYGTAAAPNGGTGGTGGTGGSITLSTPGTLTLTGSIYAEGGGGGYGGDSYYYYDSTTSTYIYTGTGGDGGAGGVGGSVTVNAASIDTTAGYISAIGGSGGYGSTYGTAGGNAGMNGTGGSVSIGSTVGDIGISGISAGVVHVAATGNLSLNGMLSSDASGDAVVLATGGNFSDNSGWGGISAPNGRWLIYSADPMSDDVTGLAYDFKQYNALYNSTTVLGSGNGLLYSLNPNPVVTLDNPGVITKTYDGTVNAPAGFIPPNVTSVSLINGDSGTVILGTAVYNDAHVALANSLLVGFSLGAVTDSNGKPVYGYPTLFNTAVSAGITPAPLTSTAMIGGVTTKMYDGTVSATGATLSGTVDGAVAGDVLTLDASGLTLAYNSAHVASATSIGATGSVGFAIGSSSVGSQTTDYSFTAPAISPVAGGITVAPLTATAVIGGATTKVYDGTTAATGATLSGTVNGAVAGDVLTLDASGLTLAYNSAHVASATSISATGSLGLMIGSSSAGSQVTDYSFTGPVLGSVAGSITAKALTSTASIGGATTKVYDGTVAATGAMVSGSITGAVGGDTLALDASGLTLAYNSAHVANATSIGAAGSISLTISSSAGSQATDYSFTAPVISPVAGSITARGLTMSLTNTGVTKPYDGTTTASFTPAYSVSGLIGGDTAASFATTGMAYNDAHVAGASHVTASGLSLTGIASGLASPSLPSDYGLGGVTTLSSAAGSASITPAVLTVSGDWSTPTSWIGNLLPQNTDLLGVLIPGGTNVTFDGLGGPTSVPYLTSAGKFSMTGGVLTVAGTIDTVDYAQSGGALTAANVNINSAGAINQTGGSLTTPTLTTVSVGGTTLNSANAIGSIQASNSGSGDIALTNTGALSIAGISNSAGNINISNAGPMSMNESQVYTSTGTVTLAVLNGSSLTLDNGSLIEGNQGVFIGSSGVSLDHASTIQTGPVATANVEMVTSEGDITLASGSTINAGHDVILTLTGPNAQVVLNAVPGQLASAVRTESASSTHINFLSRTSGGIVIDGVPTATTVAGGCGFYAKGNPATPGNGLEIVYPGSNATDDSAAAPAAQVIDQYFAEVTQTTSSSESTEVTEKTGTTSEDDKKKKKDDSGNNEGKDNNEHHNGKTGQCT
ncbi:exported protein of unknown function [Georgfuchsia toluolica]|uniref:Filamentous haemagglutinin FhaB/tRNA nuclease CdiA-like TPS domain-containing protein n=1 Tax=Georgfuchsia toluolica TaxID=424218 RepID=A0A916J6K2_9PROT|nr:YDG domain-containing protein [Georgfuchsia toluolica]CAG4884872.1 exported protein of unknown function [Georgfuchsia toluolica]